VRVGVIGCGSFVTTHMAPHFAGLDAELYAVANRTAAAFPVLASRFRPGLLTTSTDEMLADPAVDAVIIGTRHDLHAPLALRVLDVRKPVHVEKPMAMTLAEAESVLAAVRASDGVLTVGYNRRFAPVIEELRNALRRDPPPRQFLYRVNAPPVPHAHWTLDPEEGGGRLIGEGCHFIDLLCFLSDSEVEEVGGAPVGGARAAVSAQESFSIVLRFANGDVGTVIYAGHGADALGKERIEVFGAGRTYVVDDLVRLETFGARSPVLALRTPDKGIRGHLGNFFDVVRGRAALRTTAEDGHRVARIIDTFLHGGSARRGGVQR
jgi:predicted dehydrogenase